MEFKNKQVTIVGLGKSGVSSAIRLSDNGANVIITDKNPEDKYDPRIIAKLKNRNINIEFGGHTMNSINNAELVVVCPDVHLDIPLVIEAKKKNIPVISEVELAAIFIHKPIIAITGTNGKTTTTTLIGEMLRAGGYKIAVAGNIGDPLIDVEDSKLDYVVAEISSYQLEACDKFKPWISVLLNIQPDHLERHHTMEEYIKTKQKIFANQTSDDYVVYNEDDPIVVEMVKPAKAKRAGLSKGSYKSIITLEPGEIKIPGRHNLENALAAANTARICGVSDNVIADVLKTFPGVEHRIEFTGRIDGVEYYNDSKGTNPDSTLVAIDTFPNKGIVLILGGRDKGVALNPLASKVKEKVREVILIGEAAARFKTAFELVGFTNIHLSGSMADAVIKGASLAKQGEIVLLSPACASFDMFKNYEERGRVFKAEVLKLKGKK